VSATRISDALRLACLAAIPLPPPEIEIRESPLATQRHQARVFPKRKAKNAAHHRRMNNKWIRRYGFTQTPCAYLVDASSWLGGRGQILVAHPALIETIRRATAKPNGDVW
jgi:hypothetical protein